MSELSTSQHLVDELQAALPDTWVEPLQSLADTTLNSNAVLRVTLVGAFSVGKSSLLNMLIGESLLQTALQETTALPTFIEHGPQRAMQLLMNDGTTQVLNEQSFSVATTQAPKDATCAVLTLPQAWLEGVSIIDLPGLGSVSAGHQDYTLTQIQQADAVLYLLDPRGPTAPDLKVLTAIRQYGKRVKVMVTRWDEVEAAAARGERLPSLEQWAAQIEAGCGLRVRLAPCHRQGLGRDEVLDFLQRACEDRLDIRTRRFKAELQPLLDNALGQNAQAQRSCEADSEDSMRMLHAELMQRKQTLSEFKDGLQGQQQQDRQRVEQQCLGTRQKIRSDLGTTLQQCQQTLQDESGWERFGAQGADGLRAALAEMAAQLSHLSADYGQVDLPVAQVGAFNVRLPAPEAIDAADFLDVGKLSHLQQEIEHQQQQITEAENKLLDWPVQDLGNAEQTLQQLLRDRQQVASMPLPRIMQQIPNSGNGAIFGRMLGEIADIGLLFVNPVWAGAKVAGLIGKGAKIVNVAAKTGKIASTVSKGIKIAQATQTGIKVRGVAPETLDKLKALEMLSLGYWGERIGTAFGGPSAQEIVDPAAEAEQAQAMSGIESDIQRLRRELGRQEDMANERQLTGWALEQNRKEQARLQADLARRVADAAQQHREAEARAQQDRLTLVARHAERAVAQWMRSFDQQSTSMLDLMRARIKDHWENRVEALVAERMTEVDALMAQMRETPQQKQAALAQLQAEEEGLRLAMTKVTAHG